MTVFLKTGIPDFADSFFISFLKKINYFGAGYPVIREIENRTK